MNIKLVYQLLPLMLEMKYTMAQAYFKPYWRPELRLSFKKGDTEVLGLRLPKYAMILKGYGLSITVLALSQALPHLLEGRHNLNIRRPVYWTNMYRWLLRYLTLVPESLGEEVHFSNSLKVWRNRFGYMRTFLPTAIQNALLLVPCKLWKEEVDEYNAFDKHAAYAFRNYFRFGSKRKLDQDRWLWSHESDEVAEAERIKKLKERDSLVIPWYAPTVYDPFPPGKPDRPKLGEREDDFHP